MPHSLVWMCLAHVTLLQTALTRLTGTSCLETRAGSVGKCHWNSSAAFLQLECATYVTRRAPPQELNKWHACPWSDQEEGGGERTWTDGHPGCGGMGWRRTAWVKQDFLHPTVRRCLQGRSTKDFFCSRLRISPLCHLAPISRRTKFKHL